MKLKRKLKIFLLVFVLALCQPLQSFCQSYLITEEQLAELEKNNNELTTESMTLKKQVDELKKSSDEIKRYCRNLENKNNMIKTFSIVGVSVSLVGGFFLGFGICQAINK